MSPHEQPCDPHVLLVMELIDRQGSADESVEQLSVASGGLVRATSSSTFNLEEADAASSDADVLAKMRISAREAKEARVAIRIIVQCKLAAHQRVAPLVDEADQLAAILFTIVKNREENLERGS